MLYKNFGANDTHKLLLQAKDELAAAVENMKHSAIKSFEAASNEARKRAYDGRDSLQGCIKNYPLKSVGIAFLTGAAIATFLRFK